MSDRGSSFSIDVIEESFKQIQNHICDFLVEYSGQNYREDKWKYYRGTGGGITRVWESPICEKGDTQHVIEKGGVHLSSIGGSSLPHAALNSLQFVSYSFRACGISIFIHPTNPFFPTIHLNIRYFEVEDANKWWFGGAIDLTPSYVADKDQIIHFHKTLKNVCLRHCQNYDKFKQSCDEFFWLTHRKEELGVGGIFFDQIGCSTNENKQLVLDFVVDLGYSFVTLYKPFFTYKHYPFSSVQREFQLLRRARIVEFMLLLDRGTQFGIQTQGRTEAILMSMPAIAHWRYDWQLEKGSEEEKFVTFYLQPQNWVEM